MNKPRTPEQKAEEREARRKSRKQGNLKPRRLPSPESIGFFSARQAGAVYHPVAKDAWGYDAEVSQAEYARRAHALHVQTFYARVEEEQRALRESA